MIFRTALLILLLAVGSVASANGMLIDRPGKSAQLWAFLPDAPKGWTQADMPILYVRPPDFPWAYRSYDTNGKTASVVITAGVRNRRHLAINHFMQDKKFAAKNGYQTITLNGRPVLIKAGKYGTTQLSLNVGRDITVEVSSMDKQVGFDLLNDINLDQLESLEK